MRTLERNKQKVFYALYDRKIPIIDEYGNPTGEYEISYTEPVLLRINVSPAVGEYQLRQFGGLADYDRVLITDEHDLPIAEDSVFWIDNLDTSQPHDYVVKRLSKGLNSLSIAVSKVNTSV